MLIYENIYNQYIEDGGLGEEFLALLELKRKWVIKRSEWLLTGNKGIKMDAVMLGIDIKDKENELDKIGGVSKEEGLAIISESVGHLSEYDITLKQFQTYINLHKSKR